MRRRTLTRGVCVCRHARFVHVDQQGRCTDPDCAGCPRFRTRSKYNVDTSAAGKAKRTVEGIVFHSQREALRYRVLTAWENAGLISQIRRQVPYVCVVNGQRICEYRADFEYMPREGTKVTEDSKGARTGEYRIKRKLVEALFGIRIREV